MTASLLSPPEPPVSFAADTPGDAAEAVRRAAAIAEIAQTHAAALDRAGAFPAEDFARIAAAGLLAIPLQRQHGGLGFGSEPGGTAPLLRVLTEMGRGNLAMGRVYEGHVNALQLIQQFGTPEQIAAYAADARRGHLFGVWNTEAGDGVHIHPLGGGQYRLVGAKTFSSGCGYVTRAFASGKMPDGGWQMCIVPMDEVQTTADPSWWQVSGMRSSVSYRVDFTGVEVRDHAMLGVPGDYTRQPWLSGGAIRFAAVQLGGARALYDATRAYLHSLSRTDDPYQRVRVADMAIAVETGRIWLENAAAVNDDPASDTAQIVAYANMTRTVIERVCLETMRMAEQAVGARGMIAPWPVERIVRDLTLYLRQPAPDAALAEAGRYALASWRPTNDEGGK